MQDEIARSIAEALTKQLLPKRVPRRIDAVAYQNYLQAQYFFNQRTEASGNKAVELLKDAITRQPDFAEAYAVCGHVLMLLAGANQEMRKESRWMTAEALRLDPDNREAIETHLQQSLRAWDWDAVDHDGHRILASGKRDALAYDGMAWFYQFMGFPKHALDARRRAAELDPLHFAYRRNFSLALAHVGRWSEAIAAGITALELQPQNMIMIGDLCEFTAQAGKLSAARLYREKLLALRDAGELQACDLNLAFRTRSNLDVRALIAKGDAPDDLHPSGTGVQYALAGDLKSAMKLFSQAYDKRDYTLITTRYDAQTPISLLRDPRWLALWHQPLLRDWQRHHDRIAAELARNGEAGPRAQ